MFFKGSNEPKLPRQLTKTTVWEFLFLAANIDAVETAASVGVSRDRAVNYHADSEGTEVIYETVCAAVSQVRQDVPLTASWSERISRDFLKRKKK